MIFQIRNKYKILNQAKRKAELEILKDYDIFIRGWQVFPKF